MGLNGLKYQLYLQFMGYSNYMDVNMQKIYVYMNYNMKYFYEILIEKYVDKLRKEIEIESGGEFLCK